MAVSKIPDEVWRAAERAYPGGGPDAAMAVLEVNGHIASRAAVVRHMSNRGISAKPEPGDVVEWAGEPPAFTRRCRNKNCINRFVAVNAQNFWCSPECQRAEDAWTVEEILQEEGSLLPDAAPMELARRAFGQKNQALRRVTSLVSMREYMRYELGALAKENPHLRYPTIPVVPRQRGKKRERQVVLIASDWQMGKLEQGIGVKVMQENRIPRIMEATRKIVEHFRDAGYTVNEGHLVFAGDMVEGCYIYRGQNVSGLDRTGNTHRITRQAYLTASVQADLAMEMASYLPHVTVHSVPGNHGRPNGPNEFADPEDNFDSLTAWWAKDRCANQKNIDWDIEEGWLDQFEVMGHRFVATHGDAWAGPLMPHIERLLPQWALARVFEVPEVFITAHRHSFCTLEVNGVTVVQNGTIDGGSLWYTKKYGKMSRPSQTVLIAGPERAVEAVYPVYFS